MRTLYILAFLFLYIFSGISPAQEFSDSFDVNNPAIDLIEGDIEKDVKLFSLGFTYHYGFAIPHAKEVVNIKGTNPVGYELNFNWLLYTKETWNDCHCYPRLGLFLSYYDFDITEIFGYGYVAGMHFTYYFGLPSTFNFLVTGKAGLSYLTKPYDKETHPENMSYSTHLNYLLSAGAGLRLEISKKVEAQFFVSMNHNSNAALTEPNGGINYPALSFGLGYTFSPVDVKPRTHPDPYLNAEKKKRWDISLFWGISSMPYPDPTQVPMFGINVIRSWQVMRFGAVTAGAELEMNGRARLRVRRGTIEDISPWRGSLQGGWEFLMGRTIFSIQLGLYVYRPHKHKDDFYQRYGLVHRILDNFYAGINFKSYRNWADHLDLRLTYSF
ncbi:MAG: acyloxyacyl hydrolase [Ignavibacteriaceae bacterium]